jgi:hypothetical protein
MLQGEYIVINQQIFASITLLVAKAVLEGLEAL